MQRQQQTDLLSAWEAAEAGTDARLPGGPVAGLEGGPVAGLDGCGGSPDIEVKLLGRGKLLEGSMAGNFYSGCPLEGFKGSKKQSNISSRNRNPLRESGKNVQ